MRNENFDDDDDGDNNNNNNNNNNNIAFVMTFMQGVYSDTTEPNHVHTVHSVAAVA